MMGKALEKLNNRMSDHPNRVRIEAPHSLFRQDWIREFLMGKKTKLHPTQQRALDNVWKRGMTDAQMRIVDALDKWSVDNPDSPTIHEIMGETGLSYGAVWTALAVLEYFGYIAICRDCKGRMYQRGLIVNHGFDLSEDSYE